MIFLLTSSFSILIPTITGFYYHKKLSNFQKYFLYFVTFSIFVEISALITAFNGINNLKIFQSFLLVESLFFYWFLKKQFIDKYHILLISLVFIISGIILFIAPFYITNNKNVQSIFFISNALGFIIQSMLVLLIIFDNYENYILDNFLFWIFSARIIYFLIILFYFMTPVINGNGELRIKYGYVFSILHSFANFLCNLIYTKSFLCKQTANI